MLRESMNRAGTEMDIKAVTGNASADGSIPHAQLLADFAEAVTLRQDENIAARRGEILERLGPGALVDAASVAAAFHGNCRVADATGAPAEKAGGGNVTMEFREEVGINEFYAVAGV